MTAKRIQMKKLRELIRLKFDCKLKNRQIAASLNMSASSVSYYSRAAVEARLNTWPLDESLDDNKLSMILEPYCTQFSHKSPKAVTPDWETVHREMQKKHVTLQLLHEEYLQQNPELNYSYSQFCRNFKKWRKRKNISMTMHHKPGEKLFIDYCGDTVAIYSRTSDEVRHANVFIATMGYSNYTFAHATFTQTLPDWVDANVRAMEFFGGVPELLIPDNLKAGITDSCKYDPVANPTYADFANHYNTVILPARPYKPKDKGKVENAVRTVQQWILARLRKQRFYSLVALNNSIQSLLVALNSKKFQVKDGCRHSVFLNEEQGYLKPLPKLKYEIAEFKALKVRSNYHVSINKHYYSVPHQLIGEIVDCRISSNTIEVFHKGIRIASHIRDDAKGLYSTLDDHLPANHLHQKNWHVGLLLKWAEKNGESIHALITQMITSGTHHDRCHRFHMGLKNLAKQYTTLRLNNACARALADNTLSYKSISSILKNRLDEQPHLIARAVKKTVLHKHIRGSTYYHSIKKEKIPC